MTAESARAVSPRAASSSTCPSAASPSAAAAAVPSPGAVSPSAAAAASPGPASSSAAPTGSSSPSAEPASPSPSAASVGSTSASAGETPKRWTKQALRDGGYDLTHLKELPPPPAKVGRYLNHYDPNQSFDTEQEYMLRRVFDRRGRPPKLAYLVEWNCQPRQYSWEWQSNLTTGVDDLVQWVDEWKSEGSPATFLSWYHRSCYSGASASPSGRCFLEACQAALLCSSGELQITSAMWEAFTARHTQDLALGARKSDQVAFLRYARDQGARFDFNSATKNLCNQSIANNEVLKLYTAKLHPGWYIVHAAEAELEHCFAMRVSSNEPPCVINEFKESQQPQYVEQPLDNLEWIDKVFTIRQIIPTTAPFKRKKARRR